MGRCPAPGTVWLKDIDEQEELAAKYKIMSVPTLLVFRNGEIIDKSIDLIQKHEVKALFAK